MGLCEHSLPVGNPQNERTNSIGTNVSRRAAGEGGVTKMGTKDNTQPVMDHFAKLSEIWRDAYNEMHAYLRALDGETSRKLGKYVAEIVEADKTPGCPLSWNDISTARLIHGDTELWHQLANSRKK